MRNRAKCKLCNDIIESYHATDYVTCKCGEISVMAGESLKCAAYNWNNFVRVDDKGNEIVVAVQDEISTEKPDKKQLLDMLDEMIKSYDRLPENAMSAPVSNYDLASSLTLLLAILRSE